MNMRIMKEKLLWIAIIFLTSSCMSDNSKVTIEKSPFGTTVEGIDVDKYILSNQQGMEISIINYGGIITSWSAKDKNGIYEDIVLGYNELSEYEKESPYFGAIIGRYGNRIAKGKFNIEGKEYTLAVNNGENHLHGGMKGFDKVVWDAETISKNSSVSLILTYLSKDMEEGYPGNLEVEVIYTLNNEDELSVTYKATTDKTTVINLTQHSYFNLSANFNNTILNHELILNSDSFLPVDNTLIPTGEFRDVTNTPFDFRTSKTIGQQIDEEDPQLKNGFGYDHCWVLNEQDKGIRFVASAFEPQSRRFLEVFSDEPGIQFYSGNFLDGTLPSKNNGTYEFRSGFCLETQHFPDSPNHKNFPSVILRPEEEYNSQTIFKLTVK
jgi:aldose 1-epimerase